MTTDDRKCHVHHRPPKRPGDADYYGVSFLDLSIGGYVYLDLSERKYDDPEALAHKVARMVREGASTHEVRCVVGEARDARLQRITREAQASIDANEPIESYLLRTCEG